MSSRFVIFFQEKEGSTVLMELLNKMGGVSIVQAAPKKFEPFDRHICGPLPLRDLETCFDHIFSPEPVNLESLGNIYSKSSGAPLVFNPEAGIIGFKMRFQPRDDWSRRFRWLTRFKYLKRWLNKKDKSAFQSSFFKLLAQHKVVVFVLVRSDLLRWSLSKYHGDGSGKGGHLQFKLAFGGIQREDIKKIHVDPERLAQIIGRCHTQYRDKRTLLSRLSRAGIAAHPIFYEDFLADRNGFFQRFFEKLGASPGESEIHRSLEQGTRLQKVHSEDISSFVINHEEILEKFGGLSSGWVPDTVVNPS